MYALTLAHRRVLSRLKWPRHDLPLSVPFAAATCRRPPSPPHPPAACWPLGAMASEQQVRSMPPALALLQNIARQDLPAVQAALAGGCELEWRGISALHMCAFCNWADPIPLLLARGGWV